jgi:hypothetical protein
MSFGSDDGFEDTDEFYYYVGWKYRDTKDAEGVTVTSITLHNLTSMLSAEIMARNLQESSHSYIQDEQYRRRHQLQQHLHQAIAGVAASPLSPHAFNITAVHIASTGPETLKSSFFCPVVKEQDSDWYHPLVAAQREKCYFSALFGIANHAKEFFSWGNLGKREGTTRAVSTMRLTLHTRYALTMHSRCTHYALTMHSLCTHDALTMHSRCTHYALTMHSLCTHCRRTTWMIRARWITTCE